MLKGDYDQSIIYHKQSLNFYQQLNNKQFIAHIFNNLAEYYRIIGELEQALESIESSIKYNKELGNLRAVASNFDFLIQILIEKNDLKQAQKAIEELKQMKNQLNDKQINSIYLFNKALFLKTSSRSRNRGKAEDILKQIIEDEATDYELSVNALLHLCELLLTELRFTNDLSVIEEINSYTTYLLKIAEKSHSFLLFAEIYLLKAKLALSTLDLKNARRFLIQAQRIAERWDYKPLASKIAQEHDKLRNQLLMWDDLREEETSLIERMKLAGMNEQMKYLLRNRAILTTQIKEEQIVMHKERKICIICRGDITGYMYSCNCDAFYCENCARALTDLENACWVCGAPIDISKPIKPYIKEEIGEKSKIKKPKNK